MSFVLKFDKPLTDGAVRHLTVFGNPDCVSPNKRTVLLAVYRPLVIPMSEPLSEYEAERTASFLKASIPARISGYVLTDQDKHAVSSLVAVAVHSLYYSR